MPFFAFRRFGTARSVFYHLLTSTEPYEKTASDLLTFSSLQLLLSANIRLQNGFDPHYCVLPYSNLHLRIFYVIFNFYRKLHSKHCTRAPYGGDRTFGQEVLQLGGAVAKSKWVNHSRFFPTAQLLSEGERKRCERSQFGQTQKRARFVWKK